ncbi:MAG: hypothetical protein ACXVA9_09020, partial [Bdellovibrionales bacterium]
MGVTLKKPEARRLRLEFINCAARAVVDSSPISMAVTPLTEVATTRSDALIASGSEAPSAIAQANTEVAATAGLTSVTSTLPDDPTVTNADATSQSALYSLVLAGISQYADSLGVSSLAVTTALSSDFTDGIFDGTTSGTNVLLSGTPLSPTAWSGGLAAAITTYVASPDNTSGLGAGIPILANTLLPAPLNTKVATGFQFA